MTNLERQIEKAKSIVKTNSYDMSIGELVSIYKDGELIIDPEYQRYFRWEQEQKTRFIESIMLGIPIPSIFVFQQKSSRWELVDGLQRVSTILEFMGVLRDADGNKKPPLVLEGTKMLPALENMSYEAEDPALAFTEAQKIDFRRARVRLEILMKESDPKAKYELFMRLNTGGSVLSEQEVRNCVINQLNKDLQKKIHEVSHSEDFTSLIELTDSQRLKQLDCEIILRFLAYRNVPYTKGLDVHEYLDNAAIAIASDPTIDYVEELDLFKKVLQLLRAAVGPGVFKRYADGKFAGKFMFSAFEVVAVGVSKNLAAYQADHGLLKQKVKDLWSETTFVSNSGAGTRGSRRLHALLGLAENYF